MVLKYINAVVTHNVNDCEFSTSKLEIVNSDSIPVPDSEVNYDFMKAWKLINSILNNMVNAKIYSNISNAKHALKINNLSAEINITYISDLEKCKSYHPNLTTVSKKLEFNDSVSSIRCSYTYGDSCIYKYMRYGNPECEQEYESEETISFNIK